MLYRNRQPDHIARARHMRREMGEAEKRLWRRLRRNQLGFHFRRQTPVGPYFLDFYCAQARLCIEVDGALMSSALPKTTNATYTCRVWAFSRLESLLANSTPTSTLSWSISPACAESVRDGEGTVEPPP